MRHILVILLFSWAVVATATRVDAADAFTILPAKAQPYDDCVGNPVTPICAILTFEACHIWAKRDLCRQVGYTTTYVRGGFAGLSALNIYKLRIVDQRPLTPADIPPWKGNVGEWVKGGIEYEAWRPGDLAVRLEFWQCLPDDQCVTATRDDPMKRYGEGCPAEDCGRSNIDKSLVLRRAGSTWQVLYYHFDADDHGDFWDAFWNRK